MFPLIVSAATPGPIIVEYTTSGPCALSSVIVDGAGSANVTVTSPFTAWMDAIAKASRRRQVFALPTAQFDITAAPSPVRLTTGVASVFVSVKEFSPTSGRDAVTWYGPPVVKFALIGTLPCPFVLVVAMVLSGKKAEGPLPGALNVTCAPLRSPTVSGPPMVTCKGLTKGALITPD